MCQLGEWTHTVIQSGTNLGVAMKVFWCNLMKVHNLYRRLLWIIWVDFIKSVEGKKQVSLRKKRACLKVAASATAWVFSLPAYPLNFRLASLHSCTIYMLLFSRSVMSDSLRPMDCSMAGLPVLHHLLEFAQTHVHRVGDAIQPLSPASPPALSISQHQGLFQWVNPPHQVAKVLELQLQYKSFQWISKVEEYSCPKKIPRRGNLLNQGQ